VKDAADYLGYIKALIALNRQVVHWEVIREEAQGVKCTPAPLHPCTSAQMRAARLDHAAEQYARREVTLERAAELAGVSIYEMMTHLRQRDIPAQRRASDIRADAAAMLMRSGRADIAERLVEG
jgi:predicted HTH domain antitoxin